MAEDDSWHWMDVDWVHCSINEWSYKSVIGSSTLEYKKLISSITLSGDFEGGSGLPARSYQAYIEIAVDGYKNKLDEEEVAVGNADYFQEENVMIFNIFLPDYYYSDLFNCLKYADKSSNKSVQLALALYRFDIKKHNWDEDHVYFYKYLHRLANK